MLASTVTKHKWWRNLVLAEEISLVKYRNTQQFNVHLGGPRIVGPYETFELDYFEVQQAGVQHLLEVKTIVPATISSEPEEETSPTPIQQLENAEAGALVTDSEQETADVLEPHPDANTEDELPEEPQTEAPVKSSVADQISTETEVDAQTTKPKTKKALKKSSTSSQATEGLTNE